MLVIIVEILHYLLSKLLATEDVEVDMLNRLAAVLTDICYNSVAVCKTKLFGNFGNSLENCGNIRGVVGVYLVARADMLAGDNENVNGGLGIYVVEGVNLIV